MKNKKALRVWLPSSRAVRSVWRVLFVLIAIIIISTAIIIYLKVTDLRVWFFPVLSAVLLVIVHRKNSGDNLLISARQARCFNSFIEVSLWLPNRYLNHLDDLEAVGVSQSTMLYRQFGEALITLCLYNETGEIKVKRSIEYKKIAPIEFYTSLSIDKGIGYIMLMPSITLIAKLDKVDEGVVSHTLRQIGLENWEVERVSYDDDLILFVLKDETISNAYNFCGD